MVDVHVRAIRNRSFYSFPLLANLGLKELQKRANTFPIMIGDDVEARYRGKDKWLQGKVARDRGDNSFDVAFSNGDLETCVDGGLIRSLMHR
jgi:hypothetical protein